MTTMKSSKATEKLNLKKLDLVVSEYRLVVGEVGNTQGHIVATKATTCAGALRSLRRHLAAYASDGWGRVEVRMPGGWDVL